MCSIIAITVWLGTFSLTVANAVYFKGRDKPPIMHVWSNSQLALYLPTGLPRLLDKAHAHRYNDRVPVRKCGCVLAFHRGKQSTARGQREETIGPRVVGLEGRREDTLPISPANTELPHPHYGEISGTNVSRIYLVFS